MIVYKAWIDSDIIGEWHDRQSASKGILEYLEQNPESANVIHFGAFKTTTTTGTQPLFSFMGAENIKSNLDVEDEWA
jgi:hypothetical protein